MITDNFFGRPAFLEHWNRPMRYPYMIPNEDIKKWAKALLDFHLKMDAASLGPVGYRAMNQVPIVGNLTLVQVTAEVYKADYCITFRVDKSDGLVSQSIREIMR